MRRIAFVVSLLLVAVSAFAQPELSGKDQFPQFRTLSGLPGGGFGLGLDGKPSFAGAMGISTPVGSSLGAGRFAFVGGVASKDHRVRFFDRSRGENDSNGTFSGMMGVGTHFGNLTVGGEILSSRLDSVLNLQFSPTLNSADYGVAVGVQDVFSTGGSSGFTYEVTQGHGAGISRSFYAVSTVKFVEGGYLSLGAGTKRFHNVFGNASYNILPFLKGVAEYDSFNWNYGLAGNLGSFSVGPIAGDAERKVNATAFLGLIRGKYLTWSLALSF